MTSLRIALVTAATALLLGAGVPAPWSDPAEPAVAAERAIAAEPASAAVGSSAWVWPTGQGRPAVVRGFGPPAEPWHAGHRGVDLLGTPGDAIYAAGAGIVTYAGPVAGIGIVVVSHGDVRTTYQPVRVGVTVGDQVRAGHELGTLDLAGSHCMPAACLHWGALRGDVYLDPLALVSTGGRVRLAPLGPSALSLPPSAADTWSTPALGPGSGSAAGSGVARAAATGALAGLVPSS